MCGLIVWFVYFVVLISKASLSLCGLMVLFVFIAFDSLFWILGQLLTELMSGLLSQTSLQCILYCLFSLILLFTHYVFLFIIFLFFL